MKKTILTMSVMMLFIFCLGGCSSEKSGSSGNTAAAQAGQISPGGKINMKEESPSPSIGKLVRPTAFPGECVKVMKDKFAEGTDLSPEKLRSFPKAWDKMLTQKKADGDNQQALDDALKTEGFNGWEDLKGTAAKVVTSIMVIKAMESMEQSKENKVARGMSETIVSTMISQGNISVEDLKIIYSNWDDAVAVSRKINGR